MKTILSTLCIMTVSLFVLASPSMAADKKEKKVAAKVYTVGVSGVTWKVGCPPRVRAALEKISDVKKVEFDAASNVATVTMKPGKEIAKKDAEDAFDGTQYGVSSFAEKEKGKKKKAA